MSHRKGPGKEGQKKNDSKLIATKEHLASLQKNADGSKLSVLAPWQNIQRAYQRSSTKTCKLKAFLSNSGATANNLLLHVSKAPQKSVRNTIDCD